MVDELDHKLIKLLVENAKKSCQLMAKELNTSPSTIRRRYLNLVNQGIIKIVARVDPSKIGIETIGTLGLNIDHARLEDVLETLNARDDIRLITVTSGRYNVIAVAWATSTDNLYKIILEISKLDGVKNFETFISLHNHKIV
jgi:Lrp/AsnC family transcriptional regulator for asnA, asnC and gidA